MSILILASGTNKHSSWTFHISSDNQVTLYNSQTDMHIANQFGHVSCLILAYAVRLCFMTNFLWNYSFCIAHSPLSTGSAFFCFSFWLEKEKHTVFNEAENFVSKDLPKKDQFLAPSWQTFHNWQKLSINAQMFCSSHALTTVYNLVPISKVYWCSTSSGRLRYVHDNHAVSLSIRMSVRGLRCCRPCLETF